MKLLAVQGSPRKGGNTEIVLERPLKRAQDAGAQVKKVELRVVRITPCLEIYECKKTGLCPLQDDMTPLYSEIDSSHRLILASPMFFYSATARCRHS